MMATMATMNIKRLRLDQRGHQHVASVHDRKLQHQDQKAAHEDRFCSGNRDAVRGSRRGRGWRERRARQRTRDVETGRRIDGVNASNACERGDIQGDEIDSYKAPSTATLGDARATASISATRSKYGRFNDVDGTFLVGFEERTSESKDSQRQLS